jgi:anti-anti-sigma factor
VRQVEIYLGGGDAADPPRTPVMPPIDVLFEQPDQIGRFVVEGELGSGGFGVVYRCRDTRRNRAVAVKVLKPSIARALEGRFYDEAWVTKSLPQHPNLVALLDVGIDEQRGPFLVHELAEGHDLADHPLPMEPRAACRCLREIASALAHLHAHRVIHRDLKPSNIRLLTRDPATAPEEEAVLKVLDLGIAALLSPDRPGGGRTQAGELLGTPRYMAPEQLQRLPVDERADVYAFGLVAYEMLTGGPPFPGARGAEGDVLPLLRRQYQGPSRERLSELPTWLQQLVVTCLGFLRTERPDGFDEILRAINLRQAPRIGLRAREQEWRLLLATFPPPPVGGINPYKVLHLQRGEVGGEWDFETRLPPYVRRDVDGELDALLLRRETPFLVLSGPSKCGKSRTVFEALKRNLGDRSLLVPERLEDVGRLLEALPQLQESWPQPILWLDNVHEHLRAQSLPSGLLQQRLGEGVVVVATIWDSELMALRGRGRGPASGLDIPMLRAAREVLEHARIVRLEATVSAAERERAEALYPELAFEAGLGETFVAREHLLQRFDNGSPELKALVWALVDCGRAGLLDGTPLQLLRRILPIYLERADPGAWIAGDRAERLLERALEEGMEPVGVHQRLILHVGNDLFKVYDPLRYHIEQSLGGARPLPPQLWWAVLGGDRVPLEAAGLPAIDQEDPGRRESRARLEARDGRKALLRRVGLTRFDEVTADFSAAEDPSGTSGRVNWVVAGLTAWQTGDHLAAELAYRAGMDRGDAAAACSLGLLLESTGDREGARSAYQNAIDLGDHNATFHLELLRREAPIPRAKRRRGAGAFRVTARERGGVSVLDLRGKLTLGGGYQALHEAIHEQLDSGALRLLLHLEDVGAIDSAGVGALVGALTAAVHRGRTLRLCRVPGKIVQVLTTHGLLRIFEIFDGEEQALASLAADAIDR